MRSILVHADNDSAFEGRLQVALDLARRFEGHATLLIATPLQQFVSFDPFGGTYFAAEALAAAQADDLALESRLAERLAGEDVPWDIAMADGDIAGALAGAATFADLAVVSLPAAKDERHGGPPAMLAGDLAVSAAAPVLALPRGASALAGEAPAMVAWNGSAQAAHALRAAIPLLGGRPVVLVTVGDDDGDFPATDALRYLSRHDIHAELRTVDRGDKTVEERLEQEALAMGAGLIVMGAFGRSRLRETIFGGVTHYLLTSSRIPLFLAH
ncbi:universal stress protein [Sphingopyxis panaciterrulae]|uniref:Nucleotide-binding universal stress UspA family protein n=1 Tax=Sphingopyxis panaciterrulae TaxID=462372 RepID=A0A7W9B7P2_9SPHN|nr:universal stress protein [Sphingopyxis panaciterrulae]MBB5707748.1 nucleotide-binding universal stress UspA family protein [Sphingopyxis panaciterrulae]